MEIHFVKKARKDYPEFNIFKGDEYCYCRPKRGGKRRFKTEDEAKLWIKSYAEGFMGEQASNVKEWRSRIEEISCEEEKDDLIQEIQDFLDEKESRLDNIPDQLKESHILNDHITELQELLQEIEDIEISED